MILDDTKFCKNETATMYFSQKTFSSCSMELLLTFGRLIINITSVTAGDNTAHKYNRMTGIENVDYYV